ncbi:S49 family peptidase [Nitrosomonas communis]|uniref:Signal peptide peptidase SppA n=1 Tax=Nitrosomonas communis TaxID=44574 RepID=A0A1I4NCS0_9PROT|nr:S49 family peptidase [Nitrosomonas communis]SFM13176.1 signal peptide peptidase SppA [Nitrosomonas communis]
MQLPHIAARLYGTPLLINRAKLDVIMSVLGNRIDWPNTDLAIPMPAPRSQPTNNPGIAVIPVQGTLVKRTLGLEAASGLTSYGEIQALLAAAVSDTSIRGILLDVDSPGGETGGVFELAEFIRTASMVKPIWAISNDNAFSAAYAISSAASRVMITRTGGVGSIGVIALHVDQSVADSKNGLHYTAITAGAHKSDYSPHEPLSSEAQARLQAEVNRLYDLFVTHVATMRAVSEDAVRATEAGLYFGPEAIQAGLADSLMSFDEVLTEFNTFLIPQGRSRSPARAQSQVDCATHHKEFNMPENHETSDEQTHERDPNAETNSTLEATATVTDVREEVRRETQAIAELCLIAGYPAKAAEFIAQGLNEAQVRQLLLTMKATHQSAEILSTIDPDKTAIQEPAASVHNPLIAAVKKISVKE